MQLSFTQPTADIFYSSFSFIFLDEVSTLTFSAAKLVQATFLQGEEGKALNQLKSSQGKAYGAYKFKV